LRRLLAVAEAMIFESATDDAERARLHAELYAPPRPQRTASRRRERPAGARMSRQESQSLAAQLEAEDARLAGGRG
jgi:ribosome assembly protein YihI (activator of Der GTPase)